MCRSSARIGPPRCDHRHPVRHRLDRVGGAVGEVRKVVAVGQRQREADHCCRRAVAVVCRDTSRTRRRRSARPSGSRAARASSDEDGCAARAGATRAVQRRSAHRLMKQRRPCEHGRTLPQRCANAKLENESETQTQLPTRFHGSWALGVTGLIRLRHDADVGQRRLPARPGTSSSHPRPTPPAG